jgi:prepilin-type N-terminal cleavage/methylation domain-containing protein
LAKRRRCDVAWARRVPLWEAIAGNFGGVRRRAGYTLLELVIVVTIAGLLLAIAVPRGRLALDRLAVRSAAGDVVATMGYARAVALSGSTSVAVHLDSVTGTLRVRRGAEVLLARGVAHAHGVRLSGTRDSLIYDPRGLGRGAANLSIVIRRGAARETVFVSRLGRVR